MKDGYPEKQELDLIKHWSYRDVFKLLDYLYDLWNYNDWGFKEEWKYNHLFKRDELKVNLSTGGWSGNEDLIEALLENEYVKLLWYNKWERGGHYEFIINPEQIGFKTVSEYCKKNKVSRQYVNQTKNRFDWIIISEKKRLLRPKNL